MHAVTNASYMLSSIKHSIIIIIIEFKESVFCNWFWDQSSIIHSLSIGPSHSGLAYSLLSITPNPIIGLSG